MKNIQYATLRFIFIQSVTIFLFLILSQFASSQTQKKVSNKIKSIKYYVDASTGSDLYKGTSPKTPWQSLKKISDSEFKPGDSILFKCGEKWIGQLSIRSSGSSGRPIVFASYGTGGKPVFDGVGKVSEVVLIKDVDYINLINIEITNNADSVGMRKGIYVLYKKPIGRHFHFKHLNIHDIMGDYSFDNGGKNTGGIAIVGGADTKLDDILIEDCEIGNINRVGIYTNIQNSTTNIKGNRPITNFIARRNKIHHCSGDGLIIRYAYKPLIEYNVAYENHNGPEELVKWGVALWCRSTDEALFQYNEIYNTRGTLDGNALDADLDAYRTVFQYNYSHDNEGGFLLLMGTSTESIARFNVSINDGIIGEGVFDFNTQKGDSVATATIYNNTVFLKKEISAAMIDEAIQSTDFYNNIFCREGPGVFHNLLKGRSGLFSNNLYNGYINNADNLGFQNLKFDKALEYAVGINSLKGLNLKKPVNCKGIPSFVEQIWTTQKCNTDFFGNKLKEAFPVGAVIN